MANQRPTIRISSSISNFREKLLRRTLCEEGGFTGHTVFFGLYHPLDYLRLIFHVGRRTVFWCGGDVYKLATSRWLPIIRSTPARHFCENEVEQVALKALGICAYVCPMIFDQPPQEHFTPSLTPHVYLNAHPGREAEYGVGMVLRIAHRVPDVTFHIYGVDGVDTKNVRFHGQVANLIFNQHIKGYQAALRLNRVDGFSEVLAKSVLLGQYPISFIHYPHIDQYQTDDELVTLLCTLKSKTQSNPASAWWRATLEENLRTILA